MYLPGVFQTFSLCLWLGFRLGDALKFISLPNDLYCLVHGRFGGEFVMLLRLHGSQAYLYILIDLVNFGVVCLVSWSVLLF